MDRLEKFSNESKSTGTDGEPNGLRSIHQCPSCSSGSGARPQKQKSLADAVNTWGQKLSGEARGSAIEGDAFARNQNDLAPFVRSFYKKHRTLPKLEDALNHLHDNKLFSGDWSDNENGRAKRVHQVLASLAENFDPKLLKTGDKKPVELSVEKFSWWVRNHFYKGMTANVVNLQGFDPVTMTAPVQRVSVPASFIETFLSVADFCLNQDPLKNKAVPTNRFKKIWPMVKGGDSWNQTYYQVVRDGLNRMGVLNIFDRHHDNNKAWRWEAGKNFPAQSWREHQQKLSERLKGCSLGVSYEEFINNTIIVIDGHLHNTLYQTNNSFLSRQGLWNGRIRDLSGIWFIDKLRVIEAGLGQNP